MKDESSQGEKVEGPGYVGGTWEYLVVPHVKYGPGGTLEVLLMREPHEVGFDWATSIETAINENNSDD